jgi:hypothetical protein
MTKRGTLPVPIKSANISAPYRLVIVSNLCDFLIRGENPQGTAAKLESFSGAGLSSFWTTSVPGG